VKLIAAKPMYPTLIFILAFGLMLSGCGGPAEVTEAPVDAPNDTPEVIDSPVPTDSLPPTITFTPEATETREATPTFVVPSTVIRECNPQGAYSLEMPKTNYRFKDDRGLSYVYRIEDYILITVERKTNEAQTSLTDLLDEALESIKTDMQVLDLGEYFAIQLPAGDALSVHYSGTTVLGETINGQLTIVQAQDGTVLVALAIGKFDGPNDMWVEEGQQVYKHLLESIEVYPQGSTVEACPTPGSPNLSQINGTLL
jgi:hypothetical protein